MEEVQDPKFKSEVQFWYKKDNIKSIQEYKDTYNKYKKIRTKNQRIKIEDDDIKYLERYLLLGISRELIAKLFSMSSRTLRRFIKGEEESNTTRFRKDDPTEVDKKLIIHKTTLDKDPFKSKIDYSYVDFTLEDYKTYESLKYYMESRSNKRLKK